MKYVYYNSEYLFDINDIKDITIHIGYTGWKVYISGALIIHVHDVLWRIMEAIGSGTYITATWKNNTPRKAKCAIYSGF